MINALTRETHVTYPLSYCYVITEGQANNALANFNARTPTQPQNFPEPSPNDPILEQPQEPLEPEEAETN
jgi:hypothetical protein